VVRAAVFLDRDGVLNHAFVRDGKSYPPDSLGDFRLIEGVAEACRALRVAGFLLFVVTNQPDVAAGKQKRSVVEQMHQHLMDMLPIDEIFTCFHEDSDQCVCRKPKPGMLLAAAEKHSVDLSASFMVGDRWRDIDAGLAAGCRGFFIDYGYKEQKPTGQTATVGDLREASERILALMAGG
jgi:D-glycero-D-manno-heptose 1,7-bisphosphate phosphatase